MSDHDAGPHAAAHAQAAIDKDRGRIGMWLFICTEILLFGGLFLLYSVYRYKHPADFHAASLNLSRFDGTLNTLVLITSSLTAALAVHELREGRTARTRLFIGATILLALTFLTVKGFEWAEKFRHGLYPDAPHLLSLSPGADPLFRPLFHDDGAARAPRHRRHGHLRLRSAVHVEGEGGKEHPILVENATLFWHLVDVIWIFLFPLFYLIS